MKEPEKIPLDPSTPVCKKVKQIPLPSLDSEQYTDTNRELSFWKFIEKHKQDRYNWIKEQNQRINENNKKSDKT